MHCIIYRVKKEVYNQGLQFIMLINFKYFTLKK